MGTDIRVERLDEIYGLVRAYPAAHPKVFETLEIDVEDFVQEVMTNIFRRKGLHDYDPEKIKLKGDEKTKFAALIWRFCKNHLIDISRARFERKSRLDPETKLPYSHCSLDEELDNGEGETHNRHELIASEPEIRTMIIELMDAVPDEQISPNYKLSWRELFLLSYQNTPEDIGKKLGISSSRVAQLQVQMGRQFLNKKARRGDLKKEEPELTPQQKYRDYLLRKVGLIPAEAY